MSTKEKFVYQPDHQAEFKLAEKRINELIDFIIEQLIDLPEIKNQDRLIYYILRAIAEEENQAFSHSFYRLVETEDQSRLSLADSRYPESDILNVILGSIGNAQGQERKRYQQEFGQFERLVAVAADLLDPQSLLINLEEKIAHLTQEKLVELGFSPADSAPAPELVRDYRLNWDQNFWKGPKWVYVMPKSEIHPGGMAVMAVVTPTFLEDEAEFGLHQTQLLVDFDNQQLAQILNHFKVPQPVPAQEVALMQQLVQLPADFQTLSGAEAIQELIEIVQPEYQSPEIALNDSNIQEYASLVRRIFTDELRGWAQEFNFRVTQESKERLAQFVYHVVFKGLKNQQFSFKPEMANLIEKVYQRNKTKKNKKFAFNFFEGLSGLGFGPALTRVTSISGCVGFAPMSAGLSHMSRGFDVGAANFPGGIHPCLRGNHQQADATKTKAAEEEERSQTQVQANQNSLQGVDLPPVGLADFVSGYDLTVYHHYLRLYANGL